MSNPVSVGDVQDYFERTLTTAELARTQALLDDGWEQILTRVPGVESRISTGELRVGAVVAVLRQAVAAVLRNAGGFLEESIDDWTGRRDAATSTGRMILTEDDLMTLRAFTLSGVFEITLGGGDA